LKKESFADRLIKSGKWKPHAKKMVRSGTWKCYENQDRKWVTYTYEEAAKIVEHQQTTTERLLSELQEMFKPLPPLNEEETIQNEKLYWERIRREIKRYSWDG
jgi:hypothetical protein